MRTSEIQAAYGVSRPTISNLNKTGARPDVGVPPPWENAEKLRQWYQTYYRWDPNSPEKLRRNKLPEWLEHSTFGMEAQAAPPEEKPVPLTVLPPPESLSSSADDAWSRGEARRKPAEFERIERMGNAEAMEFLAQVLAERRNRYQEMDPDERRRPEGFQLESQIAKLAMEHQKLEAVAVKTGRLERELLDEFCRVVDDLYAGIRHRVERDLGSLFTKAAEACEAGREAWEAFVRDAAGQALDRVSRESFEKRLKEV